MRITANQRKHGVSFEDMTDIPKLTADQFSQGDPHERPKTPHAWSNRVWGGCQRAAALRRADTSSFSHALGISLHTLRNWEQGRRHPEGPAIALLRIAARHPRIIRENIASAA